MTQPNQFGLLTDFNVKQDYAEALSYGGGGIARIPTNISVEFRGIAQGTPEVIKAMQRWMHNDGRFPFYAEEWICLYCGSPSALPLTHCKSCGAPRSWVLG